MIAGRKVLVAGGSGLVGANLTRRLLREGAEVLSTYCTRPPRDTAPAYRRFDFTQFQDCLEATRGMQLVFLCAAQISGAKIMRAHPTSAILPNLQINAGLLEACARNHVEKVVLLSSTTVYQAASHPIREDELDLNQPPFDLYFGVGWLNRYLEHLAEFYRRTAALRVDIVRPTSLYGPCDQFDADKAHVIPALIRRAVEREDPFVVWGDGSEVRNFLYVDDLVDDLVQILSVDCGGQPLNVAADVTMTVRDAVRVILEVAGHNVQPRYDSSKPTAIPYRTVSTRRFEERFGRKARTPFEEGIRRTLEWYRATLPARSGTSSR